MRHLRDKLLNESALTLAAFEEGMKVHSPESEHALYLALKGILCEEVEPLAARIAAIEQALCRNSDRGEVTELERAVDQLQRRLEKAEEELRSSRAGMVQQSKTLETLQLSVEDLEDLDGLSEKVATLETEFVGLKKQTAQQRRLDELESQMGQQATAVSGMKIAVQDVAHELEDLEKGFAEKSKQADLAIVDFQKDLDRLQRESSKTIRDQEVLTDSHWTLNSTVVTVQRDVHELKRAREAATAGTDTAMTELERKVDELRKDADRALTGVQEELQQQRRDIEGTKADSDAAVARMQREVDRTLAGVRQDVGELKSQSDREVAGLQREVAELRKHTERVVADLQQVAAVVDLRKQIDRALVDVQQDVRELKERPDPRVADFQHELASIQREVVDLRKQADRAWANVQQEVRDLRTQPDPAVADLQREVLDLRKQADRAWANVQQEVRDFQSQLDPAVVDIQREVADLRKQADRTLLTVQDNMQVMRDMRSQPDTMVANLQREFEDLRNQVARVSVDAQQAREHKIQLDPAVTDLRRRVDDLIAHGGGGSGGQVDQWLVRELGDKASIKQLNTLASEIQLELRDLHSNLAAELRELNALLNKKVTHRQLEIALAQLRAEIIIPQGAS